MRDQEAGRLTPIPLDTPVMTYTAMLSDSNELEMAASWCGMRSVEQFRMSQEGHIWHQACTGVVNDEIASLGSHS